MVKTKTIYKVNQSYAKPPKKPLWVRITAIAALLLVLTVWFFDDIMCLMPFTVRSEEKYMIGGGGRKTAVMGDDMIICANDGVYCITSKAKQKWSLMTSFPEPVLATADNYAAVSSKNSKEIYVIDKNGKSTQIPLEDSVNNVKISNNGYVTALVHKSGYNGGVVVYNKKGTPVFSWSAGKSNLIDATLAPNGRTLVISTADFSGETVQCSVMMFDIAKSAEAYSTVGFGDNLVVNVSFIGNGRVLCVGDKSFVMCNSRGKEKWRFDYEGRTLNFFDVNNKNNLVFVLGSSSLDRNMNIYSFRKSGIKNGKYSMEFDISQVAASKRRIILSSERELVAVSKFGRQTQRIQAQKDVGDIGCFESRNRIFVDYGGYISTCVFK